MTSWGSTWTEYPQKELRLSAGQKSRMSHDATMANIGLFGKEVLPVIKERQAGLGIMR